MGPPAALRGDRSGHRLGEARPATGLVHHAESRHIRLSDPAVPHTASVYLPNGLPPAPPYQGKPGFFRQGNLPETLERLGKAGLRDFYEGEIAALVAADVKSLGGVLSLEDLRNCHARTWPAEEVGWRGRTLQLTGGLTAAPTLKRVLEGMADAPYTGKAPTAAWYVRSPA